MTLNRSAMDMETRILIVDDDEGIRTLISDFLIKHGYATATVADPMKTEIIAPPQVASSLVDLPLERYVSAEASQPHE